MSGSNIGKTLYVAAALPATNTEAGFEALTWVKVNGVESLPQFGVTHANIDIPDLQTGFTSGVKGAGTGNDSSMTFHIVDGDAGQEDLRDLANAGGDAANCSIRTVMGSGTNQAPATGDPVQYAQGYAHSYVENQADTTTYEGFSANFKQGAPTINALYP